MEHFGLTLEKEKSRLIEFGRFAESNRNRRGEGKPETFTFLGFTHYCSHSRNSKFRVKRKENQQEEILQESQGNGQRDTKQINC